jgi:predicted permease
MDSFWGDFRFAGRQLLRSSGISAIAVLTLALGIAANSAIFTLTWDIVLSGLPVPHPSQLVEYVMQKGEVIAGLSGPEYRILRDRQKACSDILAWSSDKVLIRRGIETRREYIQLLTPNALRVLQIQLAFGQGFDENLDAAQHSQGIPALLSYDNWQRNFQGSDSALGQTIAVDGHPVTIIGVMPRGFDGLTANLKPALYLPISFGSIEYGPKFLNSPGSLGLFVLGRLRAGVRMTQADAELQAIAPSLRTEADPSGLYLGQMFKDFRLTIRPGRSGISWVKMTYQRPLLVLELLILFVLALCCINTAIVMQARVSGRQQEFAMRSALGASRARLIRQLLIETALMTIPGVVAGTFLGWLAAHVLVDMLGQRGTPALMDLRPNMVILAVNIATAVLVAVGAGLTPALRASRVEPSIDLKSDGRGLTARGSGEWALSLQIAVSLSLVTAAMLFGGTLSNFLTADSGFRSNDAAVAILDLTDFRSNINQEVAFTNRFLQTISGEPAVSSAGYVSAMPLSSSFGSARMFSVDRDNVVHSNPNLFNLQVTPGYFEAAGTRILGGSVEASLGGSTSSCVLSDSAAHFFFPRQPALGELIYSSNGSSPDGTTVNSRNACRVAAIVEDVRFISLRQPAPMTIYEIANPADPSGSYAPSGILIVRSNSTSLAMAAIKSAATKSALSTGNFEVRPFSALVDQDLSRERVLVSLSTVFAIIALLLTALGLYGLLTRTVTLRTREIGIRIAVGARRRDVIIALSRRTGIKVVVGVMAGLLLSGGVDKIARQLLQSSQVNGGTEIFLGVALVLFVSVLASIIPLRRIAKLQPTEALRSE